MQITDRITVAIDQALRRRVRWFTKLVIEVKDENV